MIVETRDVAGGVRILTLNRPPAHAIDHALLDQLGAACERAAGEENVRAVVLTGSGRFFCGGLDLKRISAEGGAGDLEFGLGCEDGLFSLWTLPKPTVAMINGHAVAGGAILALACDLRIACSGDARIGLNEVAIGLAFPTGAWEIVRAALTQPQARRVVLGARLHAPEVARDLGIVDEVLGPDRLEETCLERARTLGAYPAQAYAHSKRALQRAAIARVRGETVLQRRALVDIWTSPETVQTLRDRLAEVSRRSS
jgi:enoyl-CoA hydratase